MNKALAPRPTALATAASISGSLPTSKIMIGSPIVCAAAITSFRSAAVSGEFELTSTAMDVALGTNCRSSSSRFVPNTPDRKLTPVTLPPGRFMLATRPDLTGSPPPANTIGVVAVTALAARDEVSLPTTTATGRRINSAANSGSRSG